MDVTGIITNPTFVMGVSGMIGGAWRAVDWWLNHKDTDEKVRAVTIGRNIVIGAFLGANTATLNMYIKTIIGHELPVNSIMAFMYGMCGELMIVTVYNTVKDKLGPLIGAQINKVVK